MGGGFGGRVARVGKGHGDLRAQLSANQALKTIKNRVISDTALYSFWAPLWCHFGT